METTCCCGARYSAFRSTDEAGNTLTYATVRHMMYVGSDDSSLWVCRSRGAVLRFWSFLKRSQWEAMHGYCDAVAASTTVATDSTVEELPAWVTEGCEVVVEIETTIETSTSVATVVIVYSPAAGAAVSLAAISKHSAQKSPACASGSTIHRPLTGHSAELGRPPPPVSGRRCRRLPRGRRATMYRRPPMVTSAILAA